MEPQTELEDDNNVSDVTPRYVKTSRFSHNYKDLVKLLVKSASTNSTFRLLCALEMLGTEYFAQIFPVKYIHSKI